MFTAHSSPNINIKDFLLTIWNSVFPLKIQEILVWFTKPIKTIKHKKKGKNHQEHNKFSLANCQRRKNLQHKEDILEE